MHVETLFIKGCRVTLLAELGQASIEHAGDITWDDMQHIKTVLWGDHAVAIEVYPPDDMVVNNRLCRHLWRLGEGEFWPDLLGRNSANSSWSTDHLAVRYADAWAEAKAAIKAA